jgi:hypothetical protein
MALIVLLDGSPWPMAKAGMGPRRWRSGMTSMPLPAEDSAAPKAHRHPSVGHRPTIRVNEFQRHRRDSCTGFFAAFRPHRVHWRG